MGSAMFAMEQEEWISARPGYNISLASASSTEQALPGGRWEFISTVDCWVERGVTGVTATAQGTSSVYRPAGVIWYHKITLNDVADGNNYFAAISDATDGTLYIRSASR